MKRSVICLLIVLICKGSIGLSAQNSVRGEFCLIWYNVENLFYPENDSIPGDDEFTPEGPRFWSWSRYRKKLTALSKVIVASGRGEAPELVALCEVENARVMEELSNHPVLAPYNYSVLHKESQDHRGMDVTCLIRKRRIELYQWDTYPFTPPVRNTRDVMHLTLCWDSDTLDLFFVHLLSKYGGAGATAELRRKQAGQVVELMDSVYAIRSRPLIIAAGDFNEEYQGYSMEPLRSARFGGDSLRPLLPGAGIRTYKYKGRWSPIDQVLLIQSMEHGSVSLSSLNIPPLLTEDLQYGGNKPRRSYEGFQYKGGISDHLPLVLDFTFPFYSVPGVQ